MAKKKDEDELIGTTPASFILEVSAETVRAWTDRGMLPFQVMRGGRRVFKRSDVERVAAERRKGPKKSEG